MQEYPQTSYTLVEIIAAFRRFGAKDAYGVRSHYESSLLHALSRIRAESAPKEESMLRCTECNETEIHAEGCQVGDWRERVLLARNAGNVADMAFAGLFYGAFSGAVKEEK